MRRTTAFLAFVGTSLVATRARGGDDAAARARAALPDVFARREFDPLADAERIPRFRVDLDVDLSWLRVFADLLKTVIGWIGDVLRAIFNGLQRLFSLGGRTGDGGASVWVQLATWLLVALVVGLVVWLLLRARGARARRAAGVLLGGSSTAPQDDDALSRTPEDWLLQADRMAAGGRGRDALRAVYLALLAELHRLGAIRYDRTRTNTAYVRDLPSGHAAYAPFLSLTLRFDRAWYGGADVGAEDLQHARGEADRIRDRFRREVRVGG